MVARQIHIEEEIKICEMISTIQLTSLCLPIS
jgi:hypothetical protein